MSASISILAMLLCAFLCSCTRQTRTVYQDNKVKVVHKSTVNFANAHASHDEMWLIAFGKTYKQVRGQAPFYLELTNKKSILFVTGRTYDDGQATVHVLNYKTGEETNFPGNDSHIGDNIIAASKMTDKRFEKVESLDGDKLVIAAGFLDRRFRYFIDLRRSEFEQEEATYSNPNLGTTNSYVLPNGRNSARVGGPVDFRIQPGQ